MQQAGQLCADNDSLLRRVSDRPVPDHYRHFKSNCETSCTLQCIHQHTCQKQEVQALYLSRQIIGQK